MTATPARSIDYSDDLALALELADAADAISLDRFTASDLQVHSKPDLTPVSDADLAVERRIRELLTDRRPDDAVLGEEFGTGDSTVARRWVVDPIDGTKNFVRGVPVWATLIALFDGLHPHVGVVSAPALGRRWWAASGAGAWSTFAGGEPRRCRVSAVRSLSDASISYSDPAEWIAAGRGPAFDQLLAQAWRTRGYGDFWSYTLVAEGAVDVALEPELSLWDLAALVPVVQEAGGRFTDTAGDEVGPHTTSALASNGLLHDAVTVAIGR